MQKQNKTRRELEHVRAGATEGRRVPEMEQPRAAQTSRTSTAAAKAARCRGPDEPRTRSRGSERARIRIRGDPSRGGPIRGAEPRGCEPRGSIGAAARRTERLNRADRQTTDHSDDLQANMQATPNIHTSKQMPNNMQVGVAEDQSGRGPRAGEDLTKARRMERHRIKKVIMASMQSRTQMKMKACMQSLTQTSDQATKQAGKQASNHSS